MYEIVISKQVQKKLNLLDDNFVSNFFQKAKLLASDPFDYSNNLDIIPLKGMPKGFYRLRIGDFRFLYEVRKEELFIFFFKADSRDDVYKS